MKLLIAALIFLFALQSCVSNSSKVDSLKTKVALLEYKVDSLILILKKQANAYDTVSNTSSKNIYNPTTSTINSKGKIVNSGRCMATTQRGSGCSRRVRSGGHCWQHGG